jgi:hypothetical protein
MEAVIMAEQIVFDLGPKTKVCRTRKKRTSLKDTETEEERRERQRRYQRKWTDKNRESERERNRAYRAANRERENARCRQWFIDNPNYRANNQLKKKYGITLAQKGALLLEQGGCAICKSDDPGSSMGWHLDHCHESKKVRGVLCAPCNVMLGGAKDDVATLESAISYLKKHGIE